MECKSDYYKNLVLSGNDVLARYNKKIELINNVDPYTLQDKDLQFDTQSFPPVTSMDIVSYLVLTHSFYTGEQIKAYKSLLGYKYFESGFIQMIGTCKINTHIVVVGSVKHSQRMNQPPLKVWIIAEKDGSIRNGHCTCMAGVGEACSHIAAILYYLEYINTNSLHLSCTDVKAQWKIPRITNVPIVKLSELQQTSTTPTSKDKGIPPIVGDELNKLLCDIHEAGTSAALMRVVEPFATSLATLETPPLLSLYNNLYKEEHQNKSYEELAELASEIPQFITNEECETIELATKSQSTCKEWYNQRSGRITASRFKAVCRTSLSKPSISLLKTICYPLMYKFSSKATKWGLSHENDAFQEFCSLQMLTHEDFVVEKCGFIINPTFPQFGASPDGITSCSCCGKGTLEIKCPYVLKDMNLQMYASKKNSCLTIVNGDINLDKNHSYFYQIQMQMKIANLPFCDFVVWSPQEIFLERIYFNEDFWAAEYLKALDFHKKVILPELLGRYYTNDSPTSWCWCKSFDDGRPMIKCENDTCNIQWFHLDCVNLTDVPNILWICNACVNI
ncbi:hypothetical protein RN001_001156 [Aquatica leii]|uniref:SWIM-type domain-containing protein n=1 Tax=Aquatica leii TaxID=1421715 RepID=A0AAN7QA64_9COLE|nr:hypothetical protein RN001_001156 [Aquatica leii]